MRAVADMKSNGVEREDRQERPVVSPEVNIYETEDGYVLEAEMPGVPKDGIEVLLEGNTLTFAGKRVDSPLGGTALFREVRPADYRRVFELDPAIDTARISAEMRQGILVLNLPKAERVKPRKIDIK